MRDRPSNWPKPLGDAALRGLAGEFVRLVEPHTEADPVALLAQFLTGVGNLIGGGPCFVAERDRHGTNLFVVLVGETAKGRKGSSWGQAHYRLALADPQWADERIQSGLSSGEGLIWAVRDPISRLEAAKPKAGNEQREVVTDPGISDKRLLVFEAEFASTLRVLDREGSTLSAHMRQSWDNGSLRVLTKNSPAKATGAHISIIGHITADELRRYLTRTELGNGFANRFLWICVQRARVLPDGGAIDMVDFEAFEARLRSVIARARQLGWTELRRDEEARALWHEIYEDLSDGRPGLVGAVTSRAEAQTMRLALLYAVLDESPVIRRIHLEAALALWRYADDSAHYIFGDALGDPVADRILVALADAPNGLTRSQISKGLFAGHRRGEMSRALRSLEARGAAVVERVETDGRFAELWRLGPAEKATEAEEVGLRRALNSLSSPNSHASPAEDLFGDFE